MKGLLTGAALLMLVLQVLVAFDVRQAAAHPTAGSHWFDAKPDALNDAAELELRAAVAELADREASPGERIARYRERLARARALLVRSLDVDPAQPEPLASVATIDFELAPADRATRERVERAIETAAALAPRVPRVQAQLGELLLRAGFQERAVPFLARAVELDASYAQRAVTLASAYGVAPERLRAALPDGPESWTALRQAVPDERLAEYLDWVEEAVGAAGWTPTAELLRAYGDATLSAGSPRRLRSRLESWGPYDAAAPEAARLIQLGRAALAEGRAAEALELGERGLRLQPDVQRYFVFVGDAARAAGDADKALRIYRDGLARLARREAPARDRAFLYRRIGEAQEERFRSDLAYDAYVHALELDPEEPHARRQVAALRGEGAGTQ